MLKTIIHSKQIFAALNSRKMSGNKGEKQGGVNFSEFPVMQK